MQLYGIDAPEMNYCNKIKNDEKELHLPAALLIKLGYMSFEFLKTNLQIGEVCNLLKEENNLFDNFCQDVHSLVQ